MKADGKDLGTTVVNKETMQNGWTQIRSSLPATEKPMAVEIAMEPVTPPAQRRGPGALSITVPQLGSR